MASWLRQSTSVDIPIGPFVDNIDGFTPESGLVITQPDIRLKKNGGNWAQKNAAQTLTHEENGWYELSLNTTDTNTLGILLININKSGAIPVWHEFQVVTANVWDSYFSTDLLNTHVTEMDTGVITNSVIDVSATNEIVDAVWDEVIGIGNHDGVESAGTHLNAAVGMVLNDGTAQAGGVDSITLDTNASTTTEIYTGCQITITEGAGAGQSRYIVGYTSGRIAYVTRPWATIPNATSVYSVHAGSQIMFLEMGLAQSGSLNTVQLRAGASATDNIFKGQCIRILSGTGDDQIRSIIGYDGSTKIATVNRNWEIAPDSTSYYGTIMAGSDVYVGALNEVALNAIADTLLKRDLTGITGEAARSLLNAIRKLINKWSISGTTLTVTKEDDSTTAFTQTITPAPGADPISGLNTD